jgi:hypothetical protein
VAKPRTVQGREGPGDLPQENTRKIGFIFNILQIQTRKRLPGNVATKEDRRPDCNRRMRRTSNRRQRFRDREMRRERARRPARFSGKRQRPCAWSRTLEDERKRIALGLRNPPRRPKQVARSSAAEGRCSNDKEWTSRVGPAIR